MHNRCQMLEASLNSDRLSFQPLVIANKMTSIAHGLFYLEDAYGGHTLWPRKDVNLSICMMICSEVRVSG